MGADQGHVPLSSLSHAIRGACDATGTLFFLALCCLAGPARAQGDIAMRWNACWPAGSTQRVSTCTGNAGDAQMMLSFTPQVDIPQSVGWVIVVDLAVDADPMPSWWQLQPGGCRDGQLHLAAPTGSEGACLDAWSANGAALIQGVIYPRPGGDTRQLRMIVSVTLPAPDAFTLLAGQAYLASIVGIRFALTAGIGACEGCLTPACLVFNSAEIQRLPGAPDPQPQVLVTPSGGSGNQVTWNSGTSCNIVPVRARTWGQIKALYR